ncbi:MAG: hypothetical protein WAM14_26640 [Candidatus Nitrosopolaris sp.]
MKFEIMLLIATTFALLPFGDIERISICAAKSKSLLPKLWLLGYPSQHHVQGKNRSAILH